MPLDLQPGVTVPIPCRSCGKSFLPFKIESGRHTLPCPSCGEVTLITVSRDEEGRLRIWTEAQGKTAEAASRR